MGRIDLREIGVKLQPTTVADIESENFWSDLAANVEFAICCKMDEKRLPYYRVRSLTLNKERAWPNYRLP